MLVAGEASGDQYAAQLVTELKKKRPNDCYIGMGMSAMQAADIQLLVDAGETAVTGLFEVIRHYPRIRKSFALLRTALETNRPNLLILVDYPDFNLALAKTARKLGIKILFYISPQVWAWRRKRVKKIARIVNEMIVILPFEKQLYQNTGLPTHYYGHPLIDEITQVGLLPYRQKKQLKPDQIRHILLLPGSRKNEIRRHLPIIAAAAAQMSQKYPDWHFSLLMANGLEITDIKKHLAQKDFTCKIIRDIYPAIARADLAITCSGTSTLQLALCRVPMVTVYKLGIFTYFLLKMLVKTNFISLPNIILNQPLVPELIQWNLTPESISRETYALLEHPKQWNAMRNRFADIEKQLGGNGVSKRIAASVHRMMSIS